MTRSQAFKQFLKPLLQPRNRLLVVPGNYPNTHWGFILLRISILLGLYVMLDRVLMSITRLSVSSYREEFIYLGFLKQLFTTYHAILIVPVIMLFLRFSKRLMAPWTIFDRGNWLRFLVVLAAGLLTWVYTTYDYNLYLNQSHIIDRMLLLVLFLLVFWRPVFVFPFLTVLLSIIWQFDLFSGFYWAAPFPIIRIILVFAAFFLFNVLTKSAHITDFVLLAVSMFMSHYWVPATGKLNGWWLFHDQVHFLLPATFANGWLSFLGIEVISTLTQKLALFDWPIRALTIITECGIIFFFWRRKLSLVLMGGCILLHTGIFAVSGIFFWKWMIIDVAFIILFLRSDAFASLPVFQKPHLIASIILIAGSTFWFRPGGLSWLDSPLNYTYRFEAITTDGKLYTLPPGFFAPYDFQFTLNSFRYITKEPVLPVIWGATGDRAMLSWLQKPRTPEQIFDYEKAKGKIYYNENKTARFDDFIYQTILHWNQRLTKDLGLPTIPAPRLLWTFPTSPGFDPELPIERVNVYQVTSYFSQGRYAEIRRKPVYKVSVP